MVVGYLKHCRVDPLAVLQPQSKVSQLPCDETGSLESFPPLDGSQRLRFQQRNRFLVCWQAFVHRQLSELVVHDLFDELFVVLREVLIVFLGK